MTTPGWQKQLPDGLIMRGAVPEDVGRLPDFNADVHRDPGSDIPAIWIGEWTRDLLTKPHPTTSLDDIIVVEDTTTGKIVSSTIYFNQAWCYEGISIPFGRPELVATHPDYRNRGLIRQQFDVMHEWGRQRGHLVQGITGIPYYYRQFGYEMALNMPVDRTAQLDQIAGWGESEERTVRMRPATAADIGFIVGVYKSSQARSLFSADVGEKEIGYQLFDRHEINALSSKPFIVEDAAGKPIGYLSIKTVLPIEQSWIRSLEFADADMWRKFTAPLMKEVKSLLTGMTDGEGKRVKQLNLYLPETNPAHLYIDRNFHRSGRPYAWYIRVPDIMKLLKTIGSALSKRLTGTAHEGLTGEFLISFYRYGLNLKFESGVPTGIDHVAWPDRHKASARFPDLTFLQMLCGRKSFAELHEMFADCSAKSGVEADLLDTLFPKRPSNTVFAMA